MNKDQEVYTKAVIDYTIFAVKTRLEEILREQSYGPIEYPLRQKLKEFIKGLEE